ncbi:MAG TPA: 3-hydroxyacyl-[acyl-carrier-protein] dehydratase FabZ [Firmicutes bacterium]|jgi:3-hydroxyacyl-[acyl-carrier-protein] dehydratase|nr:3-hydroxyacyl-[acyl-carrier-protein] dehydratase FabZ [Bacillota bacterium]HAW70647.1 3-hydroxyacyl-[acyl-carrier-protein] dehydratase FabZ [Bacillota bacterium]HAZ21781.1 3-hydroxyacyl-[acyl-carrier-protein] dehydratase FabZ [Bacillota bacterium]HBE06545.1 3-hydroxyacyl-[acyl-carrier-protein] dehydratase FabZ [Bacillota bacterium]HBG45005.1 3-hydroxyacyl-[acyl-carrier-protein] dehydratase FabZ [Bacillota bacterium]
MSNQEVSFAVELDINAIKKILPHRQPFLLVDRITELEPGKRAVGIKNVTINEDFFRGHFPEEPVMPGVLLIEALAQVGAVALLSMEEFRGRIAYFGGINKARFKRKVVPGDRLTLITEIVQRRGPMGIGKAEAFVGNEKAVEAELVFAIGSASTAIDSATPAAATPAAPGRHQE